MTEDLNSTDYGENYFQDLISRFDTHPEWRYSEVNNQSKDELAAEASGFNSTNELFIDHTETDAALYLTVGDPYQPVKATQGAMKQPLDGTQRRDPYEDTFGKRVMEAYQSIVDKHDAEYLEMAADPVNILSVNVPLDYDEQTLNESLDVADSVSTEIQELNDEVLEVLEQR